MLRNEAMRDYNNIIVLLHQICVYHTAWLKWLSAHFCM